MVSRRGFLAAATAAAVPKPHGPRRRSRALADSGHGSDRLIGGGEPDFSDAFTDTFP